MKRILPCMILVVFFCCLPGKIVSAKDLHIALIVWRGETEAEKGFKDELRELGYSVQYTVFNAEQDKSTLARILRAELKPEQFDYIYTFGTTASKMTQQILQNKIPHIFNIVTAPVDSGLVKSMDSTGGNISGASSGIPLRLQIENALHVIQFTRLGILFNPREENSNIVREQLIEIGDDLNFEVVPLHSPPAKKMLEDKLQKLIDQLIEVDAVYLPSDSFIVSEAELIGEQLRKAQLKSIAAIKKYVDQGAMLGTVPEYYTLGRLAAKVVDRHQHGERLQDIPVQTQSDPVLVFNKTTLDILKVNFGQEVMEKAIVVE